MKVRDRQRQTARDNAARRLAQRVANTKPSLPLEQYAGVYADSMYGDARVTLDNGALRVRYGVAFDGTLEHWHFDTFRAAWKSPRLGRTFVTFALGSDGKVRGLEWDGLGSFNKRPDRPDSARAAVSGAPR